MAYDTLSNQQLGAEARAVMDELIRRVELCTCQHDDHAHEEPPAPFHDVRFEDFVRPTTARHVEGESADGAFRYDANVAWVAAIDPVVRLGERGAVHRHKGWGNTATDEHSTYATLSTSGSSTITGDRLFRSAEWSPTLEVAGQVLLPYLITGYYKLEAPERRPECRGVVNVPAGLKLIYGNTMMPQVPSKNVRFDVFKTDQRTLLEQGHTLADVIEHILPGHYLRISGRAPNCWDGANLDSADHRSHMAYTLDPYQPTERCPDTHPYLIPTITRVEHYIIPELAIEPHRAIRLSSDMPDYPAGSSMHWDYMECIHPEARRLMFEVMTRRMSCSGSDFGNGTKGVRPAGYSATPQPKLVAVPV